MSFSNPSDIQTGILYFPVHQTESECESKRMKENVSRNYRYLEKVFLNPPDLGCSVWVSKNSLCSKLEGQRKIQNDQILSEILIVYHHLRNLGILW